MFDGINRERRRFLGAAAITVTTAAQLALMRSATAQSTQTRSATVPTTKSGSNTSFGTLRQIDVGALNVGYAEAGPAGGPAVLLLHGWPYDIYSFVDVARLLAARGYRVLVPYLRGYDSRARAAREYRPPGQGVRSRPHPFAMLG